MALIDSISVTRNTIYKGASYVAYGALASFPGALESIINPATYALVAGLTALCPTSEDGVALSRSADSQDGFAVDQKTTMLDEGEPENWAQEVSFTLLNSTLDNLAVVWAANAPATIVGSAVTQKRLSLGAPATYTERQLYIIQEDPVTLRMRVFAFRKAVPQVDSEVNIQRTDVAGVPVAFKCRADTAQAEHRGPFGYVFEENAHA